MCIVDMEGIHEGLESMSAFIRSSPRDSVISASSAGHSASTEKLAVSVRGRVWSALHTCTYLLGRLGSVLTIIVGERA